MLYNSTYMKHPEEATLQRQKVDYLFPRVGKVGEKWDRGESFLFGVIKML